MNTTQQQATPNPVRVPRNWEMYTAAGNRALTKMAETAVKKLEKLKAEQKLNRFEVERVLVAYLASWIRAGYRESTGEALDTAVRECVGAFHDRLWGRYVDSWGTYEAWERNSWERNYSDAQRRVRQSRNKKACK